MIMIFLLAIAFAMNFLLSDMPYAKIPLTGMQKIIHLFTSDSGLPAGRIRSRISLQVKL